jgi:hypothetical protein
VLSYAINRDTCCGPVLYCVALVIDREEGG